jgi:hypothetical protein
MYATCSRDTPAFFQSVNEFEDVKYDGAHSVSLLQ